MLRTFGAREVHLLAGGLRAWREAGLPTQSGEVLRPAANFEAALDPGAVISLSQIRQMLSKRAQVVDARSAGRFAELPAADYTPLEQAAVILKSSKDKATAALFLEYIRKPEIVRLLSQYGFTLPGAAGKSK